MLYLGIDQHRKQLTVNLRNEEGTTLVRRQVSTEWGRVRTFLGEVQSLAEPHGGFMAMVEVCGFNDWLLKLLGQYGCRKIVLVQPAGRSHRKTDRRDANLLKSSTRMPDQGDQVEAGPPVAGGTFLEGDRSFGTQFTTCPMGDVE